MNHRPDIYMTMTKGETVKYTYLHHHYLIYGVIIMFIALQMSRSPQE